MKREEEKYCREYVAKEEMEKAVADGKNQARKQAWLESIELVKKCWDDGLMSHYASEAHKKAELEIYSTRTMSELLEDISKKMAL